MKSITGGIFAGCLSAILLLGGANPIQKEVPQAHLENAYIKLTLYLPDTANGYYRGTRFDWSGVIPHLEYKGHTFHGKWFEDYHPTTHDAIMGPVEEFSPVGYQQAKPGGHFVKIGVGSLVKPEERAYSPFQYYAIADPGKWEVKIGKEEAQFTHTLQEGDYAYRYTKVVQLTEGKAGMTLLHTLKNTGKQTLETSVYDHNFFVIDQEPTGPSYEVSFPYSPLSTEGSRGLNELVQLQDNKIRFLRQLSGKEQVFFANLTDGSEKPYDFTVENVRTKAKVQVTADRPLTKMVFWSNPKTVSPEPYIAVKVAPGETFTWKITYTYE